MTCSPACDPAAIIRDSSDSPLRFARELSINSRAERSKKRNCLGLCFYKIRAYTGLFRYDWVAAAMGKMTMRKTGTLAFMLLVGMAAHCAAQMRFDAEAVRLNNRGVAQMGQQFTERAADSLCRGIQEGSEAGAGRDQRGHRAADAAKAGRGEEGASSRPSRSTRTARRPGTTWVWRNTRATSSERRWPAFSRR